MFSPRAALRPQSRVLSAPTRPISRIPSSPTPLPRYTSTIAYANVPSKRSIWLRRLVYATIFGGLGMLAGQRIEEKVAAPPVPGSLEDKIVMEELLRIYEKATPIVMELRSNPDYEESNVYQNYSEEENKHRLTAGPLRGSRGLALQKVFYNRKEQESISVVFLGEGTEGWPTITHGGALATVIDENLGRVALRSFPGKTGVTANLQLNYRAPVYSGHFYTFHSRLDRERTTERKAYVTGEVRDPLGGLCVEASALFVVPKKLKLKELGEEY
ncbi:PaaI family thioesterase [Aspergillus ruber CBS 135680]|uniref:Thioesterase family protein n=1 Tax=Aspergillus ruber (strain CBS 135680) TaxID=1388766 RepID=A0A017SJ23_ASPRC|nr:thioesterase family protein [Aspergillus ruber CBS 135680]EYE96937.1 thioesterase family protein [Aspergillus ruber CBS 135680]